MANIWTNRIIYIDESGVDHQCFRRFAWGPRGQRVIGEASGQVYKRTTLIAGLSGGEILAPLAFEGYTNTEVFLAWVKDCLIPELEQGDVVVMDNASFHKSPKIRELLEAAGCTLVYLPPYSPDLNPIEKYWAFMKNMLNLNSVRFKNFYENLKFVFNLQYVQM